MYGGTTSMCEVSSSRGLGCCSRLGQASTLKRCGPEEEEGRGWRGGGEWRGGRESARKSPTSFSLPVMDSISTRERCSARSLSRYGGGASPEPSVSGRLGGPIVSCSWLVRHKLKLQSGQDNNWAFILSVVA